MFGIKKGQHVLVIWGTASPAEKLQGFVEELQKLTGETGKISLENVDRLSMGRFRISAVSSI